MHMAKKPNRFKIKRKMPVLSNKSKNVFKSEMLLQYFLPLIEFLNIQSQYLNVNLKT